MDSQEIYGGGFTAPAQDAARAFRAAMEAMARPGTGQTITGGAAPGLSEAAATLVLTLCDQTTGIWLAPDLDTEALRAWLSFHTGAAVVSAEAADFAIGSWAGLAPLDRFKIGTPEYPDRSSTLIVEGQGTVDAVLTGPGIKDQQHTQLPELCAFEQNVLLFPLGLDFYFTDQNRLSALPRSTRITASEEV